MSRRALLFLFALTSCNALVGNEHRKLESRAAEIEGGADAGGDAAGDDVVWSDLSDRTKWSAFDMMETFNKDLKGMTGVLHAAGHVHFVPTYISEFSGLMGRTATDLPFSGRSSWSAFDMSTANAAAVGYQGGAFDGRYAYFAPHHLSAPVARLDTRGSFDKAAAWSFFDTIAVERSAKGYAGAAFGNGCVYFAPRAGWVPHGVALRYRADRAFDDVAGWSSFDMTAISPEARGYAGVVYAPPHVYFAPHENPAAHGTVMRHDTRLAFDDARAWTRFDVSALTPRAKRYAGGVFDGRHVYFVPAAKNPAEGDDASMLVRVDTSGDFSDSGSWSTFDVSTLAGSPGGFFGGAFDGRFVYLVPKGVKGVLHGVVVRYDTRRPFGDATSWQTFDLTQDRTIFGEPHRLVGFQGATFDGQYIYFAPTERGVPVRFEARSTRGAPAPGGSFF